MTTETNNRCACVQCPGASCKCGCQNTAAPTPECRCAAAGQECRCGK